MTVKEWAKMYPEIATVLFKCSVDDLDRVIEEEKQRFTSEEREIYLTKADVDKLVEIIGAVNSKV